MTVSTVGQTCEERMVHSKSKAQGIVRSSGDECTARGAAVSTTTTTKKQQMKQISGLSLWKVADVAVLPCLRATTDN